MAVKNDRHKARRWQVYVEQELFEELRPFAFRLRLTYRDIVTDAIREWIKGHARKGRAA